MMPSPTRLPIVLALLTAAIGFPYDACAQRRTGDAGGEPPHVVFVTGDEEYRSEESMPMLAAILERDFGFRTDVAYALDEDGRVDPDRSDHIDGLEHLTGADLMVLFTRYRRLPDEQLAAIVDFVESGRPVVGFRTSTHAFAYPKESPHAAEMNERWPIRVFGQKWIAHHGHFPDGAKPTTEVTLVAARRAHPVLRGVEPFGAASWLYHVEGGGDELAGDCAPLLTGRARRSSHENELDRFPRENPVAWTKTYTGRSGRAARVFFTTLGHPGDFEVPSMRRLALNGILWAMGREHRIPAGGCDPTLAGDYDPPRAGFDDAYRPRHFPRLPARGRPGRIEVGKGERVAFVGHGFAQGMADHGVFEARLQRGRPKDAITVRNLAWRGDRAIGGPAHAARDDLLEAVRADTVMVCYGAEESLLGPGGVADFRAALTRDVRSLRRQSFNGGRSRAQVVLVSPAATAVAGPAHAIALEVYADVIREVAVDEGVPFVDVLTTTRRRLRPARGFAGQDLIARALLAALGTDDWNTPPSAELCRRVVEKNRLVRARFGAEEDASSAERAAELDRQIARLDEAIHREAGRRD